jgi:cyclohexanecarboxylate-CoA ligase
MAVGLTREQLGVTEAMIATFGEVVFNLSHNWQRRERDPIRTLDWPEIDRQREAMGLSDAQIAAKLGLTRHQVMFIRTMEERRRFRTGHYARLLELGGGKRFRPEKFTPHLDRFRYSEAALELRAALAFDPKRAREYVSRGWWRDDTLTGWLARHAAERPDAPAIVHGEQVISWRALQARSDRLAGALRETGVAKGEVVAVQLPNVAEFLIAYLAVCRLGGVLSTIHMPYRATEIESLLKHSRAVAVIGLSAAKDWKPAETMLGLRDALPDLKAVIALGPRVPGALSLGEMIDAGKPIDAREVEPPVAADPFILSYTSGTTAAPKGVPHNYHTLLSNARLSVDAHGVTADDRVLSAAPYTHLYGFYSFHIALCAGAATVLLPVFTPPDLAATIARDRPTALWTGPAHIAACRAQGLFDTHDASSLKLAIMSGSACPPELVRWFAAKVPSCAVTQLWGMTETQAALYSRPDDPLEVSANSAGRASTGTEIRVATLDDEPCAPGVEGELQVRGCLLFPGYFKNDAANASAFTADGWFRSGDLATMDAGGNVAITGRIKDVINRGGVKFNPRDVEDLLDAHPAILQSAIIPMPDAVLGERACACIALRPGVGDAPSLEAVCAYLLERGIPKLKLPERLTVVAEMPLTPTRKIIKSRLRSSS